MAAAEDPKNYMDHNNQDKWNQSKKSRVPRSEIMPIVFAELLSSGRGSDFLIKCKVDSETTRDFNVHRLILGTRSKVFLAMVDPKSTMTESQAGQVCIDDVHADVMQSFLEYIYVGECDILDSHIGDLLAVADKYQVLELKGLCGKLLEQKLSISTAVDTAILANCRGMANLRCQAIAFIGENPKAVTTQDQAIEILSAYPPLFKEIFMRIALIGEEYAFVSSNPYTN